MVLNRADLVWFLESFQTFWNVSYVRGNGFPTTFGIVPEDLGWIPKGAKSTDFDQKPWAIAHGFEHRNDLGKCWESFQTLWNAPC